MHYLYLLTDVESDKKYIGVTSNPDRRLADHKYGRGSRLLKGKELKFQILVQGSEDFIYSIENKAIQEFDTIYPKGFNLGIGGIGGNISDRKGSLNTQAKLEDRDVIKIRNILYNKEATHQEMADAYGVTRETISTLARGDSWAHVGGPLSKRRLLSEKDVLEIKLLYENGETPKNIAKKTGWSLSSVWNGINK